MLTLAIVAMIGIIGCTFYIVTEHIIEKKREILQILKNRQELRLKFQQQREKCRECICKKTKD